MAILDDTELNGKGQLAEIGQILAIGLMRLHARKSSGLSSENGESSLHYDAYQSGHAIPFSPEVNAHD
ncbi:hypothetical protein IVA96_08015 [Bradyrhizobium sp. 159]|uniref:hypothetical protein n=1 Tax=Bradyrhizobium sp. 159 TaxID=2782632 RepID=UPI001FFA8354|nr:hypothetical protein [Bradyrhizobium sp. 159]MCK1616594.1 hypothetical protein [Bradyrhizobium sp. 159]